MTRKESSRTASVSAGVRPENDGNDRCHFQQHCHRNEGIASDRSGFAVTVALDYPSPMLRQSYTTLGFDTRGLGLIEITRPVADWAAERHTESGLLTLFVRGA